MEDDEQDEYVSRKKAKPNKKKQEKNVAEKVRKEEVQMIKDRQKEALDKKF